MSNAELQAIRDAWDNENGSRDVDLTLSLADQYVSAHPAEFGGLRDMSLDKLVKAVEVFRGAEMTDDEWRVQTWIFHNFEFQNIGGPAQVQVRQINGEA
ncbi:hypothetical protein EB72_24855 [Mycobacterium sp. SWH-M1]|nr:hypothetical protein EB72_24855 [Mycobacterium sp. SWH-M1]